MGLWSSIAICLGFSVFVIVADEIFHAMRKKGHDRERAAREGH